MDGPRKACSGTAAPRLQERGSGDLLFSSPLPRPASCLPRGRWRRRQARSAPWGCLVLPVCRHGAPCSTARPGLRSIRRCWRCLSSAPRRALAAAIGLFLALDGAPRSAPTRSCCAALVGRRVSWLGRADRGHACQDGLRARRSRTALPAPKAAALLDMALPGGGSAPLAVLVFAGAVLLLGGKLPAGRACARCWRQRLGTDARACGPAGHFLAIRVRGLGATLRRQRVASACGATTASFAQTGAADHLHGAAGGGCCCAGVDKHPAGAGQSARPSSSIRGPDFRFACLDHGVSGEDAARELIAARGPVRARAAWSWPRWTAIGLPVLVILALSPGPGLALLSPFRGDDGGAVSPPQRAIFDGPAQTCGTRCPATGAACCAAHSQSQDHGAARSHLMAMLWAIAIVLARSPLGLGAVAHRAGERRPSFCCSPPPRRKAVGGWAWSRADKAPRRLLSCRMRV